MQKWSSFLKIIQVPICNRARFILFLENSREISVLFLYCFVTFAKLKTSSSWFDCCRRWICSNWMYVRISKRSFFFFKYIPITYVFMCLQSWCSLTHKKKAEHTHTLRAEYGSKKEMFHSVLSRTLIYGIYIFSYCVYLK